MTRPELEDFRKELIQTAAVCAAIVEDIDFGIADYSRPDGSNPDSDSTSYQQGTSVMLEITRERFRQDEKWGPQTHFWSSWLSILGEEFGEACKAYNDNILVPTTVADERINPPKPVRWGTPDPFEYGTLTTVRVSEDMLVERAARRNRYGYIEPLMFETPLDDDDHDPQEGRFDRED